MCNQVNSELTQQICSFCQRKIDSRITFDLKMSQLITMTLKTLKICCLLAENPKEREYNYSLKMMGHLRDFSSEHSSNIKNPLFKLAAIHEKKEEIPENYSAKEIDEGKRIKIKNYFSPPVKDNNTNQKPLSKQDGDSPSPFTVNWQQNIKGKAPLTRGKSQLNCETPKVDEDISPIRKTYFVRQESLLSDDQSSPTKHDNIAKEPLREFAWNYEATDRDVPKLEVKLIKNSAEREFDNAILH